MGLQRGARAEPLGDLKPEFSTCKNGHRQSPIDIRNPQKTDLPPIQLRSGELHVGGR
jgi:carbonic anhydrase